VKGLLIGKFRNNWRGRIVSIFEDTERPDMVYTEGHPLDPRLDTPAVVETHEPRVNYVTYIGSFNKIYN